MAVAISQFMTRVLPATPGAPSETIRQAIIDAASEFCEKTRAWDEIQDAQLLYDGINDYEVDLPSGARPLSIEAIWCGSRKLTPLSMLQLSAYLPAWQTAKGSEPLYYNAAFDWDSFRVYPMPELSDQVVQLRIQGSFQPTDASTLLPDFMWSRYRETIAYGAKARLLALPGVVWSNPALSAFSADKFEEGMTEARIHKIHGGVTGSVSVTRRAFG